ncbi:hypothetical protein BH09PLA1_BH09PLA1_33080 [soil metagenome]
MKNATDDFVSPIKPPDSFDPTRLPTPAPHLAPPWVAFSAVWCGLIVLLASIVFLFLPGSQNPRAELEHARSYSPADRFLPLPMYGVPLTMLLGIIVLWQMRKHPRPLPEPMVMQRVQAWIGIALAILAAIILYTDVALRGPRTK